LSRSEPKAFPAERQRRLSWTGRVRAAFTRTATDVSALAAELRGALDGEVHFDAGARALYSTDASNYRQIPIGVVLPRTVEDVVRAVAIARRHDAPVLPRGGGTSLAGQACNAALVLDFSRHLDRVLEIDPAARTARVEPGCILDTLRDAAEAHGLTFGPDPATHTHNSLGGMIGNNSGGVHSVMAGLTVDNVESLDILTYDGTRMEVGTASPEALDTIIAQGGRRGEIHARVRALAETHAELIRRTFPVLPRRVSGYANLDWLLPERGFHLARALVGTEATCAVVLGATLRLVPSPPERVTVILGFSDVYAAADHVPRVLEHAPLACEGLDRTLISNMETKGLHKAKIPMLPEGDGWLVIELGGETRDEALDRARHLADDLGGDSVTTNLLEESQEQAEIRLLRESGLGARARRDLGGLGGHRRSPRAARRLPARLPQAARPLRL
jgi:FAD/FMN-containing dehydrogenase